MEHRWGMAIDLDRCTGCEACVVACHAENNTPISTPEEAAKGRAFHWLRVDRYYEGEFPDVKVKYMPVMCQHCDDAPCEPVCPVYATYHNEEGLNVQVYNRCVGTRYCGNNCPYTVRFFNWFAPEWPQPLELQHNPDVAVRMGGVMEKCTFCVQRIQNAKIRAKAQIRSGQRPGSVSAVLPDGEIETACQQACPTEAIVFGDLSDKDSRVARMHEDRRSYALLPEMYTKPRNRFLARVRNPNPAYLAALQGGRE